MSLHCCLEDIDDLLQRSFTRVGELAGVFLGVFCHDLEVLLFNAELGEVSGMPMEADRLRILSIAFWPASVTDRPSTFSPRAIAMSAKRCGHAIRLYWETAGSRMALHTPCGRL